MAGHRIFDTPFASIYPHYVTKVERKGRSVAELHEVITWLTGYDDEGIRRVIDDGVTMQVFFDGPRRSTRTRNSSPASSAGTG